MAPCHALQDKQEMSACGNSLANPTRSNQDLRVFWKPVNPRDYVWKNLYRYYHEDHIAGKEDNSLQHYTSVQNISHHVVSVPAESKAEYVLRSRLYSSPQAS